jgi:hypothetical protein
MGDGLRAAGAATYHAVPRVGARPRYRLPRAAARVAEERPSTGEPTAGEPTARRRREGRGPRLARRRREAGDTRARSDGVRGGDEPVREDRAGDTRARRAGWEGWIPVVGALAAGTALRLAGVAHQVLGGDELHALRTALVRPLGEILVTYQQADHSIPLTALCRVALEAGLRPTELALRAPILACGLALLVLAPLAARPAVGPAAAARLAWLVALSPGLVLYSRIVRSYAPMVLLASAAAAAAWVWIEQRSRRAAAAYVALAAAAIWLHLLATPFVAAPLAFAALLRAFGREGPRAREVAAVGGALATVVAAFLLPAWPSLLGLFGGRRQAEAPGAATWLDVLALQAGTPAPAAVALFAALAALGLVTLARARPRLAAYGAVLVAAHAGALLALRPYLFDHALILNRYMLVCLPVELLWVAVGLGAIGPVPWRARLAPAATAAWLAAGLVSGPLGDPAFRTSPFVHHNDFVGFHRPRARFDPADVPRLYAELPRDGSASLVEAPWHPWWTYQRAIRAYQELHRGRVRVSGLGTGLDQPSLDLRNFVAPDPRALAASGADWVVVHLDSAAEEARLREAPGFIRDDLPAEYGARIAEDLRRAGEALAARLEAAFGSPDYADSDLRAWRLPRPAEGG